MLGKTHFIDLLKTIKKTWASFLSITIFVAFSIAMYTGINWAPLALEQSYKNTVDEGNLADLSLICPYGLDIDSILKIRDLDDVTKIEGGYSSYVDVYQNGEKLQYKITSCNEHINTFSSIVGNIPTKANEIALEKYTAESLNLTIGDYVYLDSPYEILKSNLFKVTAIVTHPECVHSDETWYGVSYINGQEIHGYMYVSKSAFEPYLYTDIQIRSYSLNKYSYFSDEYKQGVDKLQNEIEDVLSDYSNDYVIRTAIDHPGTQYINILNDMIESLSNGQTYIFVIISFIVCTITILRMIDSRKGLIGIELALGTKKNEIIVYYLYYTLFILILGCISGVLLGYFVVEKVFILATNEALALLEVVPFIRLKEIVIICGLESILLLSITWLIAKIVLRRDMISLLNGIDDISQKHRFYETWPIWYKISNLSQSMVNNFFKEKLRVIGTILGIAACTILITSTLTLFFNDHRSINIQFNDYYHFDTIIHFDDEQNEDVRKEIENVLLKNQIEYIPMYEDYCIFDQPNDSTITGRLFVAENNAELADFVNLESVGYFNTSTNNGVWMSYAYKKYYGNLCDNTISFTLSNGDKIETSVDGYYNLYLCFQQAIIDRDTFEELSNDDLHVNTFLIRKGDNTVSNLISELSSIDGFSSVEDFYSKSLHFYETINPIILAVVSINIVMSIILGILLVLNLFNSLIESKKKELIIMRINGFSLKAVTMYVLGDMMILTFVGILLGLIIGTIAGYYQTDSITSYVFIIYNSISYKAIILSAIMTFIIIFVMALISIKKISTYELSDINK